MKILITDDEKLARDRLHRLLDKLSRGEKKYEVIGEAKNGLDAIEKTQQLKPDIVLMDIRMPAMDGLEAARHISDMEQPPAIIFATAYNDHALEAFETHAVGYLMKPVEAEKLEAALEAASRTTLAQISKAMRDSAEQRQHICARVRGNIELIPIKDVIYFHADQKYVNVVTSSGQVLIEEPLKSLETELGERFLRIHRNALVALEEVSGLEKDNDDKVYVCFKSNDDKLEVSRRHLAEVRKIIKRL